MQKPQRKLVTKLNSQPFAKLGSYTIFGSALIVEEIDAVLKRDDAFNLGVAYSNELTKRSIARSLIPEGVVDADEFAALLEEGGERSISLAISKVQSRALP